jgi:tetratricopeptide (TPR) repeat protein
MFGEDSMMSRERCSDLMSARSRTSASGRRRGLALALGALIGALIATSALAEPSPADSARAHNMAGMRFHRAHKYREAAREFRAALTADPTHRLAAYNLACAYALSAECGEIRLGDGTLPMDEVYAQLTRALKLDPNVQQKAQVDDDLESVRHSPRFWVALGYDLADPAVIERMLGGSVWYTGQCGPAGFGCASIEFKLDGTFVDHTSVPDCPDKKPSACEANKNKQQGRYEIKPGVIILRFSSGTIIQYSFPDPSGHMREIRGPRVLTDQHPQPCSA